MDKVRKC